MDSDSYNLGVGVSKIEGDSFPEFTDLPLGDSPILEGGVSGVKELDQLFQGSKDEKFEWVAECPIEGLFRVSEMWKRSDIEVAVLDMSVAKDLKAYSKLVSMASQTDPTVLILDEEKQFCQTKENWKIFITSSKVLYKKIIK